jgi:hypothetical protein
MLIVTLCLTRSTESDKAPPAGLLRSSMLLSPVAACVLVTTADAADA